MVCPTPKACGFGSGRVKLGAHDYLTNPCEIDKLVQKLEEARKKKNESEKKDMEDKIQKVIESPAAALILFSKKKAKS